MVTILIGNVNDSSERVVFVADPVRVAAATADIVIGVTVILDPYVPAESIR